MATWIAHLRIAENIMNVKNIRNDIDFIVGNIGPDCGVPNEDWSKFDPPGEISHWCYKENKEIDFLDFYNKYCISNRSDFYIGYYVHLLTDFYWGDIIYKNKKELYKNEVNNDPKFIWIMKKDWYDLDKVFLNENKLSTYEIFKKIDVFPNKYLDFYPDDAFIRQIRYITNFYDSRDKSINRDFIYLKKEEMDNFVKEATKRVIENLREKEEFA